MAAILSQPASATPEYVLPTLFDVTGVAADDVLNIRAEPDAGAEIIDTLSPDARGVEVVAHDESGRWARINSGERSGWVALRYLAYRADVWEPGALPESLRCLGTEPFWSVRPRAGSVVFSSPDAPEWTLPLRAVLDPGAFRSPRRAIVAEDAGRRLTAAITPAPCSDGMSDRAYGLDATLIIEEGGTLRMLAGCCTIAPR
jgi:uncharacterized membrane protein